MEYNLPRDTTVAQESHDAIFEMVNLSPDDTGVGGVIFISTVMASHGPRVKFFIKAGRDQPSFSVSISEKPKVLANSLSAKVLREHSPWLG